MRAAAQPLSQGATSPIAGGSAHDLDRIKTAAARFSDLLRSRTSSPQGRRAIAHPGTRSRNVLRPALGFGRRLPLAAQYLDLTELVTALEPQIRARLNSKVELALDFDAGGCFTYMDPARLRDVILALVDNGNRSMPHGGRLILELSEAERPTFAEAPEFEALCPGRYARLALIDGGIGMDEETRVRLLELSSSAARRDPARTASLAAAHAIVRESGGCIRIESVVGGGTAIEVFLPSWPIAQAA